MSRQTRKVLWHFLGLHLAPVGGVLALLSLHATSVSWSPPGPGPNTLNALQLLSKFHEALVIMSLSRILLHFTCSRLTTLRGLRLGFITSPFQLNSPSYLLANEFYGALAWRDSKVISAFQVLVFVLALSAGPSAAILAIPKLDFWPDRSNTLHHGYGDELYYVGAPYAGIFPHRIDSSFLPPKCVTDPLELVTDSDVIDVGWASGCPWTVLQDVAGSIDVLNSQDIRTSVNATMSGSGSSKEPKLVESLSREMPWYDRSSYHGPTCATTVLEPINSALHVFTDMQEAMQIRTTAFYDGQPLPWKQPVVVVYCAESGARFTRSNSSARLDIFVDSRHYPGSAGNFSATIDLGGQIQPDFTQPTQHGFRFAEIPSQLPRGVEVSPAFVKTIYLTEDVFVVLVCLPRPSTLAAPPARSRRCRRPRRRTSARPRLGAA